MSHADSVRTTTKQGARWYDWKGERYWSVTTIISGGLPKRALIYWSANQVAEFACDNVEEIKSLIASGERDAAYDLLKRSPWRKRDKAADIGTAIHEAIEAHVLGRPVPEWPLPLRPRMQAFERFLAEYEPAFVPAPVSGPPVERQAQDSAEAPVPAGAGILLAEAPVFHRSQRYAGTLDGIVEIGGRRLVLDVKTSARGIYPEVGMQLAAYRFAEFVGLPDGSEQPLPETDGAVALHLPEDGTYELREIQADEEVFRAFLYVREVYRFLTDMADGVVRGIVPRPGAGDGGAACVGEDEDV